MAKRGRPLGTAKYPVIDGKKECGKCQRVLSLDHFNTTTNAYGRTYYRDKCKDCAALQKAGWLEKKWKGRYRRRELERMKIYYASNKDSIQRLRKRRRLSRVLGG